MKLRTLDKKIIRFAYPLQIKPGFIKRKSLLHYLNLNEESLDESIDRLIAHQYCKVSKKQTSHNGVCYELTELGLRAVVDLNKSILITIKEHPLVSSLIAILIYLFTYLMDIFKPEIKGVVSSFFN